MPKPTRKEQLEAMLHEDPNDPFLRYALAMEEVSAGADDRAVAGFRELLARSPDYVAGYQQLGQTLLRLGQDAEARAILQQGVAQAQRQGNDHAAREMLGLLESVE